MIANTESALGTVGPKFYETIACGAVNICPKNYYEGLLFPDIHYVSVKEDFSNLEYKINKFLRDDSYRNKIEENSMQFLKENYLEKYLKEII